MTARPQRKASFTASPKLGLQYSWTAFAVRLVRISSRVSIVSCSTSPVSSCWRHRTLLIHFGCGPKSTSLALIDLGCSRSIFQAQATNFESALGSTCQFTVVLHLVQAARFPHQNLIGSFSSFEL